MKNLYVFCMLLICCYLARYVILWYISAVIFTVIFVMFGRSCKLMNHVKKSKTARAEINERIIRKG